MSTPKILLIVVSVFLLVAAVAYWQLGGFKEVEVALVELEGEYRLVGKPYRGRLKSPELNGLLEEVNARWTAGELPGVLTVAVLKEPASDKDTVEQFIGVLLSAGEEPGVLPAGYSMMQLPATKVVRASPQGHPSVWPSPDQLRAKVEAFAREQGYPLQPDILFEKYHGPDKLEVEIPLQEQVPSQRQSNTQEPSSPALE